MPNHSLAERIALCVRESDAPIREKFDALATVVTALMALDTLPDSPYWQKDYFLMQFSRHFNFVEQQMRKEGHAEPLKDWEK